MIRFNMQIYYYLLDLLGVSVIFRRLLQSCFETSFVKGPNPVTNWLGMRSLLTSKDMNFHPWLISPRRIATAQVEQFQYDDIY